MTEDSPPSSLRLLFDLGTLNLLFLPLIVYLLVIIFVNNLGYEWVIGIIAILLGLNILFYLILSGRVRAFRKFRLYPE